MIKPSEKQLLKHGKHIDFGVYNDLIAEPKTSFWDDEGFPLKSRRTQRKTWIFYGVYSPEMIAGIAIVDAGLVATAFSYCFLPEKNLFIEDKMTLPFGFRGKFDPNMTDEWKLGKYKIYTENDVMKLSYKGKFELEISAQLNHNGLSTIAPSPGRPFNFTYKNLSMQTTAKFRQGPNLVEVSGEYGAIDFTKGYPPRSTEWNWASFSGKTADGQIVGCNLVDKFNANMENALWIGQERIILSEAVFKPGLPMDKSPWSISTKDGILEMSFQPLGARSENLNVAVMKSIFTQPFGKYTGTITLKGQKVAFEAMGVAEDHQAVW